MAKKAAKTKKAAPASKGKAYTAPLLPESMTLFMRRALWRGMGLTLGLIGVAVILSLASYNPADPNFNTASSSVATNLLGLFGAHLADLMLQTLGLASYALALPMFTWCWRIMRLRTLPYFWVNLTLIPVALILLAVAYDAPRATPEWPILPGYGGMMGEWIYQHTNTRFKVKPQNIGAVIKFAVGIWRSLKKRLKRTKTIAQQP